ncbi:hypothetical protein BZG36_04318, partial [Bifiguratus adelaidae]
MSIKDRTNEFQSAVDVLRNRQAVKGLDRQPLIPASPAFNQSGNRHAQKTEFARIAALIGREINMTTSKLEKLTKLAKKKSLFDDKPVEISELTYIIKQDIAKINKQIAALQEYTHNSQSKSLSKQATEHSSNVVLSLQSKLANTSLGFKDVLEIRTQNMKAGKERRDQFMFANSETTSSVGSMNLANSPLYTPDRKPTPSSLYDPSSSPANSLNSQSSDVLGLGIPMITPEQQQAQLLVAHQDNYIESRASAIESIETTIAELGNIFQQLATMVAEQRETVQRIDQNADDIEMNVSGAQKELLKYYKNISSNRWLLIKIFATIIFFFLLFTLI